MRLAEKERRLQLYTVESHELLQLPYPRLHSKFQSPLDARQPDAMPLLQEIRTPQQVDWRLRKTVLTVRLRKSTAYLPTAAWPSWRRVMLMQHYHKVAESQQQTKRWVVQEVENLFLRFQRGRLHVAEWQRHLTPVRDLRIKRVEDDFLWWQIVKYGLQS